MTTGDDNDALRPLDGSPGGEECPWVFNERPAFPSPTQLAGWLREYAQDAVTFTDVHATMLTDAADLLDEIAGPATYEAIQKALTSFR